MFAVIMPSGLAEECISSIFITEILKQKSVTDMIQLFLEL